MKVALRYYAVSWGLLGARVAIEGARDRAARHTLASAFSQVNIQDVDFDS